MKIKLLTTIIGLLLFNLTFGQNLEKYTEFKKEAEKFYDAKEYQKSADKYKEAFDQIEGKAYPNDRYNAACSYALAKDIKTAFYHLFRLANDSDYKNYGHITTDSDLDLLHKDKRWNELIAIVKSNKEESEKDLDRPLIAILDSIYIEDQKYRLQIDEIKKKYGWDSEEMKVHWRIINKKDSINLIKIKKILDERGWLGANIIGEQGNSTLFLVIQHSDIETQLKYLPMMRKAVKIGNARASSLALLEDRVALRQGKRQIYGSQIHSDKNGEKFVAPLIDPENVDKRRAKVGLGPLADYIRFWDLTWDIDKHKARTKKIESEK
ncbi:MAG: hypothetical protein N4A45_08710 [Flavobacteriales bacterium]|jgi:hypothetical protein|nr:hypothetical protein [Flavobacteriales bacterium]